MQGAPSGEIEPVPSPPLSGPLTVGLVITVVAIASEGLAVTTVMPAVVRDLGALAAYGWTFSAFMLANLVGIVVSGQATDRRGPLVPFATGLTLFALGLLAGGAAPSMGLLIAARAVQGLGGGTLSAVVYACVARAYSAEQQPRMLALLSTAWVVPGLVGPGVAGLVADHLSWRLVFLGLIPILPIAGALTVPGLRTLAHPEAPIATVERTGHAVLLAAGSVLLLLGLESSSLASAFLLGGPGAGMMASALRRLMPPGTLAARRGLPAAIATMCLVSVAFFGAETLLPLLMTILRRQPATVAGVALSAATLTWTAGAWVQAREAGRRSRRTLIGAGVVILACGIAVLGLLLVATTPVLVAGVAWSIAGLGMGIAHTTISLTVVEQVGVGEAGSGTASLQLASVLGTGLGAGTCGAAVAAAYAHGWAPPAGFALALGVTLAAAFATFAVSRRLPGRDAA